MDEDQFYHGETLDGRTGLVPSNYVERLNDQQLLSNSSRAPSPSFPLSVPHHLTQIAHDFSISCSNGQPQPLPDSVCPYPPTDITKVVVQEIRRIDIPRDLQQQQATSPIAFKHSVPFPRDLSVERKLSRSVVLSWNVPHDSLTPVSQYHICADSIVRAVVPGTFKCKALIEDVDLSKPVNISVRAVTENGHSLDAACTIALGRDAPVAPQHVRVTSITPIAANVSWYPSDSNAEHILLLNAVKVGVCPPAVFQCFAVLVTNRMAPIESLGGNYAVVNEVLLAYENCIVTNQVQLRGLFPSTIYRVSVRTKHPKAVLEQRPVERCVDFKTLPKIGLPDPPTNVQVDYGPQPGSLLVSWRPVRNQPLPPSRAAVHSYLIYADGSNIAQVQSGNADHVLLNLSDFADDPPIFITVRTRTREGAVSSDSNVSRVPRGISVNPSSELISAKSQLQNRENQMSVPPSLIQNQTAAGMSNAFVGSTPAILQASGYSVATSGQHNLSQQQYPTNLLTGAARSTALLSNQPQVSASLPHVSYSSTKSNAAFINLPNQTDLLSATATISGGNKRTAASSFGASYLTSNMLLDEPLKGFETNSLHELKSHNPYYTFHPKSLCHEIPLVDEKPSVLEMEHNYLLKHRIQQWPPIHNSRARMDPYTQFRPGDKLSLSSRPHMPILSRGVLPPYLARVRSEEICSTRSEPDLRPMALDDYNCRWFVALFDYSHHMSPNVNAQQEELSFRKHQLIKVFGEVDQDGFYTGQIGNRVGLVPSNMVIEIAKDDVFPMQRRSGNPPEPSIRRMRWGSLKSRSYDHAGDRRLANRRYVMDYVRHASLDRRYQLMPGRQIDYMNNRRSLDMQRGEHYPRSEYSTRTDHDGAYEPYRSDRHLRDYYSYSQNRPERREFHSEEREVDRDRRGDYYWDEREQQEIDRHDIRDPKDIRDLREHQRELRDFRDRESKMDPRDIRDIRDYREVREKRDAWMAREQSLGRRDHDRDERVDQRAHDHRDQVDYRDQRETKDPNYREIMRKVSRGHEQRLKQVDDGGYNAGRDPYGQHVYDRREREYSREKNVKGYRDSHIAGQSQSRYPDANSDDRCMRVDGDTMTVRKFMAKFDYDSRHLSPNVDAEQVELSFHAGDVITVFGEMDEDGFYMGELNGIRGLVPSNFLHTSPPNSLMQPQQPSQPDLGIATQYEQPKPKGVIFQEASKKAPPVKQVSQSSKQPVAGKVAQKSVTTTAQKPATKKTADNSGKSAATNVRKTSQAGKKSEVIVKKK